MPSECVKVMVRVRPLNTKERQQNCKECVDVDMKSNQIVLRKAADPNSEKTYTYDAVFVQDIAQQLVYEASAFPLVENVFEGYNGTIFAYGQTGCGKTHTMMGDPNSKDEKGIIPRTFSHIINVIESEKAKQFLVRVSFLEIYNEEIHDLLSKDPKAKYELKQSPEKGVFVKDLNQVVVKSVAEMEELMKRGNDNRSVGATAMNKDSSRSHSIFTVFIETSEVNEMGAQSFRAGKLNLVDLAGSERQTKTQATGDRLKEANKINLSLSALGNVISALVDGKTQHVPYRDSKLTRLLEDSLGGNTKTIMIAAISPADNSYDETSGTLRYASRAKNIKNAPKINEDPKDTLLKEYTEEITRLRQLLQNQGAAGIPMQQVRSDVANADAERIKLQNEMQLKDERLAEERRQIVELTQKLQDFTMKGGNGSAAAAAPETVEEQKKYLAMKRQIKKQQKIQEQLIEDTRRKENVFLRQEEVFKSLQEEVISLRENNVKLRKRLKQALDEVNDIYGDTEFEKEELLDAVRTLERENTLNKAIVDILLTEGEYNLIKDGAVLDEDSNTYRVQPFLLRNKELRFPKLPLHQGMAQIEAEKEMRVLEFEQTTFKIDSFDDRESQLISQNNDSFASNQIDSRRYQHQQQQPQQSYVRGRVRARQSQNTQAFNVSQLSQFTNSSVLQTSIDQQNDEYSPERKANNNLYHAEQQQQHQRHVRNQSSRGGSGLTSELGLLPPDSIHTSPKATIMNDGNSSRVVHKKKKNVNGVVLDPVVSPAKSSNVLSLIEKAAVLPSPSNNNNNTSCSHSTDQARRPQKTLKPLPSLAMNGLNGFYSNTKNL